MSQNRERPVSASRHRPEQLQSQRTVIAQLLEQGIAAAEAGDKGWARRCFHRVLTLDGTNEDAWLWLGVLAPTPKSSKAYFEQALLLHPDSTDARQGIEWAEKRMREQGAEVATGDSSDDQAAPQVRMARVGEVGKSLRKLGVLLHRWRRVLALVFLCVAAALVSFWVARGGRAIWARRTNAPTPVPISMPTATPSPAEQTAALWAQVDEAWNREDWSKVVSALEQIREITPSDSEARVRLASAYMNRGQELVEHYRIEQGIAYFDRAVRLNAGDEALQQARRHAIQYLPGRESYRSGDWAAAIEALSPIFRENPSYLDVGKMLSEAYFKEGQRHEQNEELEEAREAYRMAMVVDPGLAEAQQRYASVTEAIKRRKRIEIDVSSQHFTAWENNQVVFSVPCSTGRAGTPTRYGTFKVLDKIPEAWRRGIESSLLIGMPLFVFVFYFADQIILLLFTKKYIALKRKWNNFLVATSDYHVSRTHEIFNYVYGRQYSIKVMGTTTGRAEQQLESEEKSMYAFRETFMGIEAGDDVLIYKRLCEKHPYYNGLVHPKILVD